MFQNIILLIILILLINLATTKDHYDSNYGAILYQGFLQNYHSLNLYE
jgi:hypothetical protein